jgi:hypothetical protein
MSNLKHRTRRHGTRSVYAGAEPRNREPTEHWPKDKKPKRRRFKLSKRAMKRKRKDRANKRADASTYQASLTSPWSINVCVKKGGETR